MTYLPAILTIGVIAFIAFVFGMLIYEDDKRMKENQAIRERYFGRGGVESRHAHETGYTLGRSAQSSDSGSATGDRVAERRIDRPSAIPLGALAKCLKGKI